MVASLVNCAHSQVFTAEETQRLAGMMARPIYHDRRSRVVRAGVPLDSSLFLVTGFLGRFSCDRFGRRQFTAIQVPGDYVDLPAYPLGCIEHDIDALCDVEVRRTPHSAFDDILRETPELTRKLWRLSLIDSAIHRYWIFRIGRLSGKTRVANFFSEMFLRLFARDLATPEGYALPLSQTDLAEICGMTPVHLNRLLAELRLDGVCVFTGGRVDILDLQGMFRIGEHNRAYLYLSDSVEARVRDLLGG